MASAALAAIEELRRLNIPALRRKYHELFGEQSKSSHNKFLFRRIAWRLQANAEGGLSDRARRRAAEIADDSDLRTRAARELISTQALRHCREGSANVVSRSGTGDYRRRAHCLHAGRAIARSS